MNRIRQIKRSGIIVLFLGLFSILIVGCSDDDDSNNGVLKRVEAKVLNPASCGTENNGLAYRLDVDGFDFEIITATLPEGFQQAGMEIIVDMKRSHENITYCTANFFPEQFYKVTSVSRKEQ